MSGWPCSPGRGRSVKPTWKARCGRNAGGSLRLLPSRRRPNPNANGFWTPWTRTTGISAGPPPAWACTGRHCNAKSARWASTCTGRRCDSQGEQPARNPAPVTQAGEGNLQPGPHALRQRGMVRTSGNRAQLHAGLRLAVVVAAHGGDKPVPGGDGSIIPGVFHRVVAAPDLYPFHTACRHVLKQGLVPPDRDGGVRDDAEPAVLPDKAVRLFKADVPDRAVSRLAGAAVIPVKIDEGAVAARAAGQVSPDERVICVARVRQEGFRDHFRRYQADKGGGGKGLHFFLVKGDAEFLDFAHPQGAGFPFLAVEVRFDFSHRGVKARKAIAEQVHGNALAVAVQFHAGQNRQPEFPPPGRGFRHPPDRVVVREGGDAHPGGAAPVHEFRRGKLPVRAVEGVHVQVYFHVVHGDRSYGGCEPPENHAAYPLMRGGGADSLCAGSRKKATGPGKAGGIKTLRALCGAAGGAAHKRTGPGLASRPGGWMFASLRITRRCR
ncbi:hypothetical protein KL86DPRO_11125 [uncultured delta proteobacterium]|uniref:Uncharacterized protein n=1 Tax=uncultured delta proteobacterium TaxID=34034 RepID=A0A212JBW0_9DELT|nr:hypothetical protein KL86DPRO_11125 [uncultured delta proteobacterium]